MEAGKQRFGNFTELNAWLGQRCRALWDEVRHPEYAQFSVAEVLEHEQPHLMRDELKVGFYPWLIIESARWLTFNSAPTSGP